MIIQSIPQRWQRSRLRGAKQPTNVLYCGRTGRIPENIYSNPFEVGYYELGGHTRRWDRCDVVNIFGQELDLIISSLGMTTEQYFNPLFRYDWLSCWCDLSEPCHVDILIQRMQRMHTYWQPLLLEVDR
jgi:hypothetical protein